MRAALHDAMVNVAAHPFGWPLARLARRVGPVLRVPGVGVVVSDAAVAHEILTRDADFTKNGPGSISATMTELIGPAALSNMDGAAHQRLRAMLSDVASSQQAPVLLEACDEPIARLRAELEAGGTVDLAAWMRELSGRVTFDMLGIAPPAPERESCLELSALGERITAGLDFRTPGAERMRRARAGCERLVAYARDAYDAADAPRVSFVRRLRDAGLTFEEARGVISLVFLAGTLTTAAALPRIVALLADGGHLPALRRDRALLPRAIAEGLRYAAPVPATVRVAARDAEVLGHRVRAGTRVVVLTCNLARDASLFPDPDRFDPLRVHSPRARHLWFGAGPHFCLGFAVAQRELHLVLDALLSLPGDLVVVRRRAARGVIVPAYARLDVRLVRQAAA